MKTITQCSKHPKYKAVLAPKSCVECRVIWLEKQLTELSRLFHNHYHYQRQYGGISGPVE